MATMALAQKGEKGPAPMKPDMTEYWEPVPKVVDPGPYMGKVPAPSDAIVLFDGKDLSKWKSKKGGGAAKWKVHDGVFTVKKGLVTSPPYRSSAIISSTLNGKCRKIFREKARHAAIVGLCFRT